MPSETSISAVGAPGRCRLARPSRISGRRTVRKRRAAAWSAQAPIRNSPSVAAAPRQNQRAKSFCSELNTTSATSRTTTAAFTSSSHRRGRPATGCTASRNRAAPGISRARPSGQSEKASAASSP